MRRRLLFLVALAACGGSASPAPAAAPVASSAEPARVDAGMDSSPPVASNDAGAAADDPDLGVAPAPPQKDPKALLAPGQRATPLALEIARLLAAAGRHATKSGNCYDAGGQVVTIDRVALESTRASRDGLSVTVAYRVWHKPEYDTRGCRGDPECGPHVTSAMARATFELVRAGAAVRLRVPASVPGVLEGPGATPLGQDHNGDCYGHDPPFVPAPVAP